MKRVFSTLIFIVFFCNCYSQSERDTSKHLTFKGVPIDGTLNEFIVKMKKSGLEHIQTKDGIAFLKGDFASYKLCYVGVSTLKTKDLVSKIVVLFQDWDTWSGLFNNYDNLKSLLTEKYGKASEVVEMFQSSEEPKDDQTKLYNVKFDMCRFKTTFDIDKGTIQLSIEHDGVTKCFVKLAYLDRINSESIRKQALDDL